MTNLIINTIATLFVALTPISTESQNNIAFSHIVDLFVDGSSTSATSWNYYNSMIIKQRNTIVKEKPCTSGFDNEAWAQQWRKIYLQKSVKSDCVQKPSNRLLNMWYQHIKKAARPGDKINKI